MRARHAFTPGALSTVLLCGMIGAFLLFTGCSGFGGGTPEEKIHAGTKGLTIALDTGNPTQAFAGDSFTVYATVSNDGAADVDNAALTITPDNKFITLNEPGTRTLNLYGRSATTPVGEQAPLRITAHALTLGPSQETAAAEIRFDLCYAYSTDASAQVCIDPDPQSKAKKPCTMGTMSLGGGQGAPIAVTRVEPSVLREGGKTIPVFAITLDNLGDGQASLPSTSSCGSGTYNKANVKAWLADVPLTCGEGESAEVFFDKTRNTVRCKLAKGIDGTAAYATVLRVEATYDYAGKPLVSKILVVQR